MSKEELSNNKSIFRGTVSLVILGGGTHIHLHENHIFHRHNFAGPDSSSLGIRIQ